MGCWSVTHLIAERSLRSLLILFLSVVPYILSYAQLIVEHGIVEAPSHISLGTSDIVGSEVSFVCISLRKNYPRNLREQEAIDGRVT